MYERVIRIVNIDIHIITYNTAKGVCRGPCVHKRCPTGIPHAPYWTRNHYPYLAATHRHSIP